MELKSITKRIVVPALLLGATATASAFENVDFTRAAEATVNSVVSIKSYVKPTQQRRQERGGYNPFENDPFFEFFFGPSQPRGRQQAPQRKEKESQEEPQMRQSGLGSGVILKDNGLIITNNHVIDGADRLEVTLNDNRSYDATVVGTDATTDLAVIKIDADNLQAIKMGDSENLRVGEWVLAVGNPFGFTSTVTAGIVSAKARNISSTTGYRSRQGVESYIQTDAAVNPGNSGGALVNLNGELVGINTAIYSQTGNYAGNSFAIPTSIVSKIVDDIENYGTVQRALLGVSFTELNPQVAKEKNITAVPAGIYVAEVADGSGADEAGVKPDDVIVAINGNPTTSTGQLQEEIAKHRPGDTVTLSIYRDNKPMTLNVTLKNAKGDSELTLKNEASSLGCSFKEVSQDTLDKLRIPSGLQVTDIKDGKFKAAGMRDGFIIVDINNVYVKSAEDVEQLYDAIVSSDEYDHVMFISGVYPGSPRKVYYAVDIAQ
ncbi:MAG: Do family serine endopeptidase [Barnesiella sp.]|nr:Do family serine endopeptidase [Bacteroidales bacterium]MBD5248223.1 Do family serine endopeptidase [Barnesiella sp.]